MYPGKLLTQKWQRNWMTKEQVSMASSNGSMENQRDGRLELI